MNKGEFVSAVKINVATAAANKVINLLEKQVTTVSRELKQETDWYSKLGQADRDIVKQLISRAADAGVYEFLQVLDGAKSLESGTDKGVLRLLYEKNGASVQLNDATGGSLHELY
ncbi:hypothetical protein [Chitinophaga solisilvae]|uniref:Uncharacterized protein n=1 Tax=Chitinophaga solisilvae TaxID=1233460 RepID=A0A3S1JA49_9BACT|nr:hypothetical protein [Chitinophaga solisilvae]NSL86094.1 hypothetical protein [Chitinophaga solisilvae]